MALLFMWNEKQNLCVNVPFTELRGAWENCFVSRLLVGHNYISRFEFNAIGQPYGEATLFISAVFKLIFIAKPTEK